jgi:hypothetical protein
VNLISEEPPRYNLPRSRQALEVKFILAILVSIAVQEYTHSQAAVRLTLSDRFYNADAPPQVTREGEMIEFLAQMPTDTMIFLTMAVLSLAVMLIVLRRLI